MRLSIIFSFIGFSILIENALAVACTAKCQIKCYGVHHKISSTQLKQDFRSVSNYRKFCRLRFGGNTQFGRPGPDSFIACTAGNIVHNFDNIGVKGILAINDISCRRPIMFHRFRAQCRARAIEARVWSGWDIQDCQGNRSIRIHSIKAIRTTFPLI